MEDKNIFNQMDEGMMEFFINAEITEIESLLLEEGVDLNDTKSQREKFAKKIKFMAKAKLNKQKDESLLEKATSRIMNLIEQNKAKPIALLRKHIEQRGIAFQFRSLDKLEVDDIREILNELDLVELMEKIEKEEGLDNE